MKIETDLKKIKETAQKKEDENWEFRSFLKGYDTEVEELDSIVHRLFELVSMEIDCTACGNCCREVRDPGEPLMKIMTRVLETRPQTPGSVLVRGGRPLRLLAVVLDLNREPSWKEEWIETGLQSWAFPP